MALKFNCSHCGSDIVVKHLEVGESALCRSCSKRVLVPQDALPVNNSEYENIPKTTKRDRRKRGVPFLRDILLREWHYADDHIYGAYMLEILEEEEGNGGVLSKALEESDLSSRVLEESGMGGVLFDLGIIVISAFLHFIIFIVATLLMLYGGANRLISVPIFFATSIIAMVLLNGVFLATSRLDLAPLGRLTRNPRKWKKRASLPKLKDALYELYDLKKKQQWKEKKVSSSLQQIINKLDLIDLFFDLLEKDTIELVDITPENNLQLEKHFHDLSISIQETVNSPAAIQEHLIPKYIGDLNSDDWLVRFSARHALFRFGSEAISYLIPVAEDEQHRQQNSAKWLIKNIAKDSQIQRVSRYSRPICPDCLTRFDGHAVILRSLFPLLWVGYYGCRTCHQNRRFLDWAGDISAVLDAKMNEEHIKKDEIFQINALRQKEPFDFDRLEIIDATDKEVESFCIRVKNDTDPKRLKNYKNIGCLIKCDLSENTLRILRNTFGEVQNL